MCQIKNEAMAMITPTADATTAPFFLSFSPTNRVAVKSMAEMQDMASETSSLGGFSKRSLAKMLAPGDFSR